MTDEPDELGDLERDLARLEELVDQGRRLERELDERLLAATANGASQRDLASATGMSKSTVARRLASGGPLRTTSDAEDAEWREAMQAERLRLAKLRTAKEATRLSIQQSAAEQIRQANDLTRITELDRAR